MGISGWNFFKGCHRNLGSLQGSQSNGKTWKNGKAFCPQGKFGEFQRDWKSQGKSQEILEKSGNFRQILFVFVSDI